MPETPFARTVLGDVPAAELGVTYAHEHLAIVGGRMLEREPDLDLSDVDRMVDEVGSAVALGLRTVVDAMPNGAGRSIERLVEISERTSVNVIAATGLHHERWYDPDGWFERATEIELAAAFAADIVDGIDATDDPDRGRPTHHRAGIIKIAGSEGGPSDRDRRVFAAAAEAHRRTGAPILTHCENGTGALEQVAALEADGVDPSRIILSHVDRVVDRGYHRDLLATGATAEYDGAFRWGDAPNGTLTLLRWMTEDGLTDRLVLGLDAARRGYLRAYGGGPGLTYLLDAFGREMAEAGLAELRDRLLVANPARVLAFDAPAVGGIR